MSRGMSALLIGAVAVLVLGSMSVFTVDERELAIKFRLGEFVRADYEPGLHFKTPFINNVRKFDSRILTLDADPERFLTVEKKNVFVDAFIKWRISNVESFYKTTNGNEQQAGMRLRQIINDALRSEFGKRTIQEAISGERSEIMDVVNSQVADRATEFGIKVVDVRIKRVELPQEVSSSVYRRMEAERSRVAKELRAQGHEAAERLRAEADRQVTVLLAEARRDAERIRGQGDARATEIYADAFTRDEEFYGFYRSLQAYNNVFDKPEDLLVLDPTSEFFEYFKGAEAGR
ncbi:MAG TPA: protease modulator HflC [Gammaproteobacteria bacterium]|nr:protease modulator HflC [Gammaproteobacteria bacterium]